MVIIISIFYVDNIFSMNASLSYGSPMNTDIDDYETTLDHPILKSPG